MDMTNFQSIWFSVVDNVKRYHYFVFALLNVEFLRGVGLFAVLKWFLLYSSRTSQCVVKSLFGDFVGCEKHLLGCTKRFQ